MERILLFDGNCRSCSSVARLVESLGVSDLTVRPISDPKIVTQLRTAGLAQPTKPALVRRNNDGGIELLTGLRMRFELAKVLGFRRSRQIMRLAAAETRARMTSLSRRNVLLATGGAVGAAVVGGGGSAAAAPGGNSGVAAAQPQLIQKMLADFTVREAVQSFGPIDSTNAIVIDGPDEPILALAHSKTDTITFVGLAAGLPPAVISMRALTSEHGFEYLSPGGHVMARVRKADGRVVVEPGTSAAPGGPAVAVDYYCVVTCLGANIGATCFDQCVSCVFGGPLVKLVACPFCAACAGPQGVRCVRDCS